MLYTLGMKEKEVVKETAQAVEEKQTEEVEITKEDTQYKVYGYDVSTSDPVIQKYYQATMSVMSQANLLVGDFDKKGNYVISKEIKRDIVVMDKEIEEIGDKFFKAASLYMKKNFYFYISISQLPEGKAKAKLYLYEYVGDFLDKEFVISHIANFVDEFNEDFKAKVRKAFNLVDVDVPNNDFQTPSLAIRMQQMLDEQLKVGDMYELACQMFTLRLLKCLENNVKGRLIVAEFKKLLAKFKGTLSFKMQKALLDKVINKLGGYEMLLKDNPEGKMIIEQFLKSYNDIQKAKNQTKTEEVVKADADKGKSGSSKSGGGKSSSKKPAGKKDGGGKKDQKKGKKDDKKEDKKSSGHLSAFDLKNIVDKVIQDFEKKWGKSKPATTKSTSLQTETPQPEKQEEEKPKEIPDKQMETADDFERMLDEFTGEEVRVESARQADPAQGAGQRLKADPAQAEEREARGEEPAQNARPGATETDAEQEKFDGRAFDENERIAEM